MSIDPGTLQLIATAGLFTLCGLATQYIVAPKRLLPGGGAFLASVVIGLLCAVAPLIAVLPALAEVVQSDLTVRSPEEFLALTAPVADLWGPNIIALLAAGVIMALLIGAAQIVVLRRVSDAYQAPSAKALALLVWLLLTATILLALHTTYTFYQWDQVLGAWRALMEQSDGQSLFIGPTANATLSGLAAGAAPWMFLGGMAIGVALFIRVLGSGENAGRAAALAALMVLGLMVNDLWSDASPALELMRTLGEREEPEDSYVILGGDEVLTIEEEEYALVEATLDRNEGEGPTRFWMTRAPVASEIGWCDALRLANRLSEEAERSPRYEVGEACETENAYRILTDTDGYQIPKAEHIDALQEALDEPEAVVWTRDAHIINSSRAEGDVSWCQQTFPAGHPLAVYNDRVGRSACRSIYGQERPVHFQEQTGGVGLRLMLIDEST